MAVASQSVLLVQPRPENRAQTGEAYAEGQCKGERVSADGGIISASHSSIAHGEDRYPKVLRRNHSRGSRAIEADSREVPLGSMHRRMGCKDRLLLIGEQKRLLATHPRSAF